MWVKICANTSLEDALGAAEAGADAAGFVFAASKRQVTPEQVREITAGLPVGLERVGVFGEAPAEEIAAAAHHARLTTVQLHGSFDPALPTRLRQLLGPELSLLQTVHWSLDDAAAEQRVEAQLAEMAEMEGYAAGSRVLLDAKVAGASGGLGVSFDWVAAGRVVARHSGLRVILAGGLRPDNVADAVGLVRPFGVDVASGVESGPGRKDLAKVRLFVENARGA